MKTYKKILNLCLLVLLVLSINPTLASASPFFQTETNLKFSFSELGISTPQVLSSPFQEFEVNFSLPLDWEVTNSSELVIALDVTASSLLAPETTQNLSGIVTGEFSVWLDGQFVFSQFLQQTGPQSLQIPLQSAQFRSDSLSYPHHLLLRWDARSTCDQNLLSNVVIQPTSTLAISYQKTQHSYTLADYPAPFFQENALEKQELIIALPPDPIKEELQAALIIAAGLGRLSQDEINIQYLETEDPGSISKNAILIARQDRIWKSILAKADTGQPASGQGQLQLIKSSDSEQPTLLVSGTDANGIVLAAKALSRKEISAPAGSTSVLVGSVENPASPTFQPDVTFAELGIGNLEFKSTAQKSVAFSIPPGTHIGEDAYFDLFFNHSQRLDYLVSGLKIFLNGVPLSSIRLSDTSSNYNQVRLILPTTILRTGINQLIFEATLNSRVLCSTTDVADLWLNVFSSSKLHLPLSSSTGVAQIAPVFGDIPSVLLTSARLDDLAFVLPEVPGDTFDAAIQFAFSLGAGLQGDEPIGIQVLSPDGLGSLGANETNLIIVGKPSSFPGLSGKQFFPQLIFDEQDSIAPQSQVGVVLVWQKGEPQGVVAMRMLESGKTAVAILGNSSEGVNQLAEKALTNNQIKDQNFAIITSARLSGANILFNANIIPSNAAISTPQKTVEDGHAFLEKVAIWSIPALVIALIIILLLMWSDIRKIFTKKH